MAPIGSIFLAFRSSKNVKARVSSPCGLPKDWRPASTLQGRQGRLATKIKAKHERFCQEYLKDPNGAQAAIRAGYSAKAAKQIASRLLTYANVQARIAQLMTKAESKAVMSAQEVLAELSLIGRSDVAHYVDKDTGAPIPVHKLRPGASRCIRKFKVRTITRLGSDGKEIKETSTEFDLLNKEASLDMLGRHHKLFDGKGTDADRPATVNIHFGAAARPAKTGPA